MTTDRALYEEMYARQIAEGIPLEEAMRFNRASTPEDYRRAFGDSDDPRQQWRKIGGGNKMGSAGASINAKRRAQKQARDARGESDPIVSRITAFVDKLAGKEASDDSTTERTSDYRTPKERRNRERMAGQEISSVFGTSTLDGTLMAGGPDPNRGLNRGITYGKDGSIKSVTTDSDFGKRMAAEMARFKA